MTKQNFINQAEFAKLCGVSRASITYAIEKKQIKKEKQGIDIKHPKNKKYKQSAKLKAGNKLRSVAAKKGKNGEASRNKKNDKAETVPVKFGNATIDVPLSEFEGNEGVDEILITKRYMIARTSKIEQEDLKLKLQNARLRGELLDKDIVYDSLFMYLDKVNSNLERMAGAFLNDVGFKIINAEEVTPAVKQEWIDGTLKQIDMAKKEIVKRLKKIAKSQK
jgi:hypothetical protein